jgi:hypothetical protein
MNWLFKGGIDFGLQSDFILLKLMNSELWDMELITNEAKLFLKHLYVHRVEGSNVTINLTHILKGEIGSHEVWSGGSNIGKH